MEMFFIIQKQHSSDTFSFLKDCIDGILCKEKPFQESFTNFLSDLYQAYRIDEKLSHELSKFIIMNSDARKIHEIWEKKEHNELKKFLSAHLKSSSQGDIEAAAIILHQATKGLYQYMYLNEDEIDEIRIIELYQQFVLSFFSSIESKSTGSN